MVVIWGYLYLPLLLLVWMLKKQRKKNEALVRVSINLSGKQNEIADEMNKDNCWGKNEWERRRVNYLEVEECRSSLDSLENMALLFRLDKSECPTRSSYFSTPNQKAGYVSIQPIFISSNLTSKWPKNNIGPRPTKTPIITHILMDHWTKRLKLDRQILSRSWSLFISLHN